MLYELGDMHLTAMNSLLRVTVILAKGCVVPHIVLLILWRELPAQCAAYPHQLAQIRAILILVGSTLEQIRRAGGMV